MAQQTENNNIKTVNRVKKGQYFDYSLLILVLVLAAFGLVMVYSTSSYYGMIRYQDPGYWFKSQLKNTLIAVAGMFFIILLPTKFIRKFSALVYGIAFILLVAIGVFHLGNSANGAERWISIAGFNVQPAEIAKLGVIMVYAGLITRMGRLVSTPRGNVVLVVVAIIPILMVFGFTKNLSSAIIIAAIAYIMILVSNPRPKWLYIATAIIAVVAVALVLAIFKYGDKIDNFRVSRILAWKDPAEYSSETGYQTIQSLYAIGSGGFFGKGFGQSIQKLGFIPEAQNDMIFAIICEELGLFGGISLIILYILLIWRLMVIANNAPDLYSSMFVVGVMAHVATQVVLNIAVVTNTIPNTGISLPFVSYGGSSMLFLMCEMGVVLGISRQITVPVTADKRPVNKR